MAFVHATAGFIRAFGRAYAQKWRFLVVFLAAFLVSFSVLAAHDLVPEPVVASEPGVVATSTPTLAAAVLPAIVKPELPTRVVIPGAGIDVTIKNPTSTNVAILDEALLTGAVRYPTSAKLGEAGNVVLFGHSSYLPVVNNPAFKAFNQIQNLKVGERITVYGGDTVYVYSVRTVSAADASSDAIPLTKTGHTLTIATCDSFGKKTDRFIVVADLVETYPRAS